MLDALRRWEFHVIAATAVCGAVGVSPLVILPAALALWWGGLHSLEPHASAANIVPRGRRLLIEACVMSAVHGALAAGAAYLAGVCSAWLWGVAP